MVAFADRFAMVRPMEPKSEKTKPFLKWAGGKFRLLDRINAILPEGKRLIEPFAGSGALCLNSQYEKYWLNDLNIDLINLYRCIHKDPSNFIASCEAYFIDKNNQEKRYYQLREKFNGISDVLDKSALFLYLNRHSYNGLCRYNQKGGFNAPFGRYKKPYFPKAQMLAFAQKAKHIKLTHQDFAHVMRQAKSGDVIYCDPPYVPLSPTASFTQYSHRSFTLPDQEKLADLALELTTRGITTIISNHNTPLTRALYSEAKLVKFTVPRFISCKGNKRLPAKELLAIYK